jgi:hypothetical protein
MVGLGLIGWGHVNTIYYTMIETKYAEARLRICDSCENYIKERSKCMMCGCKMTFKVWLRGAKCPIDKWDILLSNSDESK